ncbi:MAG: hypothetical protein JSW64_00435 [Candidatus Zixiibacteriota bacterium]|nr:MAG: hypothetical protein JSW64_00435 [candidate division Zixibacteria bacterium]
MIDKDKILIDFAKLWLAHDGLWFQAVENEFDLKTAIKLDTEAWRKFSPIEARRILERLEKEPGGGLDLLEEALGQRLYAFINKQRAVEKTDKRLVFEMTACRVQDARHRRGLPSFPCKDVGIVEYSTFAETIDPRIKTRCLKCPPDEYNGEYWCRWEFSIE